MAYAMMATPEKEKDMTMLVIDQAVTVHDPATEKAHEGRITVIGRDSVLIEYDGITSGFRKTDQRADDPYGHVYFRTKDQAAADEAFADIQRTLKAHGLEITPGRDVKPDKLRRIADLLKNQA